MLAIEPHVAHRIHNACRINFSLEFIIIHMIEFHSIYSFTLVISVCFPLLYSKQFPPCFFLREVFFYIIVYVSFFPCFDWLFQLKILIL